MKNLKNLFVIVSFLLLTTQAFALDFRALQDKYDYVDPEKEVPQALLMKALEAYETYLNANKMENDRYLSVIDFSKHNSKERFFIIDMQSGYVESYLTAHGKKSDPKHTGYATSFSNEDGSNKTSLGLYKTAETYYGQNGYSLKLDGLSTTNSNARKRYIVIHGASYVRPGNLIGRSLGCPAVEERYHADLIDRLKGGSLLYAGLSK